METSPHRSFNRRPNRLDFRRLIAGAVVVAWSLSILPEIHADIPWPEVVQRLAYESKPSGGGGILVSRFSAAAKPGQSGLRRSVIIETPSSTVKEVFGSTRWKIVDTGGGLRRWQIDCYYGEDEPLGPGRFMARPRGTTFEYAYSGARIEK